MKYDMMARLYWKVFKGGFEREQTLADGGEYCDCHYIHTPKK